VPAGQRVLSPADWERLLLLAHVDRKEATRRYTEHYLATSGQLYLSDTLQIADYRDGYHTLIDRAAGNREPHGEMISELYVPRSDLPAFLAGAAELLRGSGLAVIYGTVRLIERDVDALLAWAREPWACVIVNICTKRTPAGIARSAEAFRGLIDLAASFGGSYFPTYHRWATVEQLLACHPAFPEFVAAKRRHDPSEVFQNDWWRHYTGSPRAG
jgi:FAD/FMN-containing dehydrogenase